MKKEFSISFKLFLFSFSCYVFIYIKILHLFICLTFLGALVHSIMIGHDEKSSNWFNLKKILSCNFLLYFWFWLILQSLIKWQFILSCDICPGNCYRPNCGLTFEYQRLKLEKLLRTTDGCVYLSQNWLPTIILYIVQFPLAWIHFDIIILYFVLPTLVTIVIISYFKCALYTIITMHIY